MKFLEIIENNIEDLDLAKLMETLNKKINNLCNRILPKIL